MPMSIKREMELVKAKRARLIENLKDKAASEIKKHIELLREAGVDGNEIRLLVARCKQ